MVAIVPSSLDSATLARRLGELVGHERNVQVEFLLHLNEFDRRRAYLDASFGSLWDYCLRHLHLREGAAGRRIGAMRVLRRLPQLEPALRDGRLCLSTLCVLGPVLTADNHDELVRRAAYRTKAEVEHLVASIQPRAAPKEGIRKLSAPAATNPGLRLDEPAAPATPTALQAGALALSTPRFDAASTSPRESVRSRPEVRPVSEEQWSVRVTIDADFRDDLETLKALLSHKVPNGDLTSVLREAIRCGIEKHGKRKGAVPPAHERRSTPEPKTGGTIPASVRREVWKRDGGVCTWRGDDGRRCGSRWQVEIDHIRPAALGGTPTVDDLRLLCRSHNMLYAEQVYGREHMDQFRRGASAPRHVHR